MRRRIPSILLICVTLAAAVAGTLTIVAAQPAADAAEVRALWVTRATLTTRAQITEMIGAASRGGFNTLLVQVRGRGDAYYDSPVEPRASELDGNPAFDPLADILRQARPAGLAVHAWVAVNLVSSAVDLPAAPRHIVNRHPEWLMVPRELARDLAGVDVRSREYVARLARWTRARPADVEGLFASPLQDGAADHLAEVIRDLVTRYDVDGVHLDYARFPNDEFDYSRGAIEAFKRQLRPLMSDAERRRLAALEKIDPLAATSYFADGWADFRRERLTALVARIRETVRRDAPRVLLSAAVFPDAANARRSKLQDWPRWLDRSLLDALCPMAYTQDAALFEQQIAAARAAAGAVPIWAGVGAYRLTPAATVGHITAARRQRAAGVVLFSYDALVTAPNTPSTLSDIGRAAFGRAAH
jgi:uncharacterized lipoprotein YddW (UPF0748 family)